MDPKMDSGVLPPSEIKASTLDPSAPLFAAQVIWIMDYLWSLEAAWLDGYPLSQTLYTSVHVNALMDPENKYPYLLPTSTRANDRVVETELTHVVLRAFSVALLKSVNCVLQTVQAQNFYEEEDFVTHLFGRELLSNLDELEAINLLNEAIEWVADSDLHEELAAALNVRLNTRKTYMLATAGESFQWPALQVSAVREVDTSHVLAEPIVQAFTDRVQRHLATSTPPRPALDVKWKDAVEQWTRLYSDAAEATQLTSFWIRQSPACLQRATWSFAARSACTYTRAIFQDRLFADGKIAADIPHFDLLLTDIRDLVLAGESLGDPTSFEVELPTDNRHRCARLVEMFMDKAVDEYMNLYRMVCQNRCRIRRTFTQAIPLFDQLETYAAAQADREINAITPGVRLDTPLGTSVLLNPLTTWSRYYKLKLMAETIHLGFETDIYLDYEMGQMYWYLASLVTERRNLLTHIRTFLKARILQLSAAHPSHYSAECAAANDWIACTLAEANVTIYLAEALSAMHNLLLDQGLSKSLKRRYAHIQLVHEARMKPYLAVASPAVPSVEEFLSAGRIGLLPLASLSEIDKKISTARATLALLKQEDPVAAKYLGTEDRWKLEIKQAETVCVALSVAVTVLRRVVSSAKKDSDDLRLCELLDVSLPAPEKRYHVWWVVPQLREKTGTKR